MNKKTLSTLIVIAGLLTSSTFAMGHLTTLTNSSFTTGTNYKEQFKTQLQQLKKTTKEKIETFKNQITQERKEFKNQIQQIREKLKPTIKQNFKNLSNEIKEKLKELREKYLPQIKSLKEKFKTANKEERQQIIKQINALREELHNKIQQIASGTQYAEILREKWQKIQQLSEQKKENIQKLREQIKQIRNQFKQARADLIAKYKILIYQKFKEKINNMSLDKLEKIKTKIEKAKEKFEKLPLSEEMKTKIMSVLAALDEIITERITELQQQEQSLNTDNILNNLLGN